MIIRIKNKKEEYEDVEVKFTSIWAAWVVSYLATIGVITAVVCVFAILMYAAGV